MSWSGNRLTAPQHCILCCGWRGLVRHTTLPPPSFPFTNTGVVIVRQISTVARQLLPGTQPLSTYLFQSLTFFFRDLTATTARRHGVLWQGLRPAR
jgi:hypothetical protein